MGRRRVEVVAQYQLAVEMADRVSARRGHANQFYVSLQSLLLGAPILFSRLSPAANDGQRPATTLLYGIGVVVACTWWLQLRSYRDLNRAKFDVITRIERDYLEPRIFTDEWDSLKKDRVPGWRKRYAELGTVERVVPLIFIAANIIGIVWIWQ